MALFCLQMATYVLPLLTLPYLARILGGQNFGVYAFAFALTQYLSVLTDYGFNLSATRAVARSRDDDEQISSIVSVVYTVKISLLVVAFAAMVCVVRYVPRFHEQASVFLACFLSVIGSVLFPVWYFQGLERMRHITYLQIFGRLIGTILIFSFVSRSSDCALAAALHSSGALIAGGIALGVIRANGHLRLKLPSREALSAGVSEGFAVFATSAMSTALQNGAVVALGFTRDMAIVGSYAAVERVMKAMVFLFSPLTQAFFPYASKKFAESQQAGARAVVAYARYVVTGACAVAVITSLLSRPIVRLLFGEGYVAFHVVLQVLAVWLVLGVINSFAGVQLLVASGRAATYSQCFVLSAAATLILFIVLVPAFSYLGAMTAMTIGEAILTVTMIVAIRRCGIFAPQPARALHI